jgi:hypothetical protein
MLDEDNILPPSQKKRRYVESWRIWYAYLELTSGLDSILVNALPLSVSSVL